MKTIHLKIAVRHLIKHKRITLINVIGLAIGLSTSLIIAAFVHHEKSTDRFLPCYDQIYNLGNGDGHSIAKKMANLVKSEIPEIEYTTYLAEDWSPQVYFVNGNNKIKVTKALTADSCFFRVFDFKVKWGDTHNALRHTNEVVITESLSSKLFGTTNPVGRSLVYNSTYLQNESLIIGAVIRDLPSNSSWDFEAVISLQTNYKIGWYLKNMDHWGTQNYSAFFKVKANVSHRAVQSALKNISLSHVPDGFKNNILFTAVPYHALYFNYPNLQRFKHGNKLALLIFQISGIFILLLACINYINMVTAQSEERFRSIGVIKTVGGLLYRVIQLFVTEAVLSLTLAVLLTFTCLTFTMNVSQQIFDIPLSASTIFNTENTTVFIVLILVLLLITGVIPGYIFGRKHITGLLKKQHSGNLHNRFRNGLLIFQFVVSITLIAGVLLLKKQSNYLQSVNLGYDKENVIYAYINDDISKNIDFFKNEMQQIHGVSEITFSSELITDKRQNWGRTLINKGESQQIYFTKFTVTPNFFSFFGIEFSEGKTFGKHSNKRQHLIINETAKKGFNIKNIDDARLETQKTEDGELIGVVKDFNFKSLHFPINNAGFMCLRHCDDVLYLKLNGKNMSKQKTAIDAVNKVWEQISPAFPFEYQFLDQAWEAHYRKDQQFQKAVSMASFLSVLLSVLGLISLTYYIISQRTKEIGIRKVNGAGTSEILFLLNNKVIKQVVAACFIAFPLAWYAMSVWLDNFAYKTDITWWILALAGLTTLLISLLTVSWQSWRTVRRNPIKALRYE